MSKKISDTFSFVYVFVCICVRVCVRSCFFAHVQAALPNSAVSVWVWPAVKWGSLFHKTWESVGVSFTYSNTVFVSITHIWRCSRVLDKHVNSGRIRRISVNTAEDLDPILNSWKYLNLGFFPFFILLFLGMWHALSVYILSPQSDVYLAVG